MPVARALLAVVVCVRVASAQTVPDPAETFASAEPKPWAAGVSQDEQTLAFALFDQGNTEFLELRYAQALAKYREAIKHWDHPAIRFNIAVCLINLEQPLEAFDNLERALKYGAAPLGEDVRGQALTYRKLLLSQLAHVKLSCKEPGASVALDGKQLFIAPGSAELDVLPGEHLVVAIKPGFQTASEKIDLRPGKELSLDVRLVGFRSATVTTRRWAQWKPWVVLGAGAVVAGGGAVMFGFAQSNMSDYDSTVVSECPCTAAQSRELDLQGYLNRARAQEVVAYSLFAVGGSVLAVGIVGVILNLPRTQLMLDSANVNATPHGGSATVGWRF